MRRERTTALAISTSFCDYLRPEIMKPREMEKPDGAQPKRPYGKPTLRQIELRPEEAVLGACKSGASAGPAGGACTTTVCSSIGS